MTAKRYEEIVANLGNLQKENIAKMSAITRRRAWMEVSEVLFDLQTSLKDKREYIEKWRHAITQTEESIAEAEVTVASYTALLERYVAEEE